MKANMHEAKSRLSQLAEAAAKGERVVIAKSGKPYVELVPCTMIYDTPKNRVLEKDRLLAIYSMYIGKGGT